jgi:hypothetical protein
MFSLDALSLCCNLVTLIGFAGETLTLCKRIYQGQPPGAAFRENAENVISVSLRIQSRHQSLEDKELADVAKRCNNIAQSLKDEYNHIIKGQKNGSLAATLKIASRYQWRRNRLERLETSLTEIRGIMDTHLLARVW